MRITKLLSSLFIIGSAQATVEIAIDNHKIEQALHTIEQEHREIIAEPAHASY